ncbi:MAG TPA: hypothetical protein VEH04_17080 [Verrucomicrobiae bacterium]|nr:hypothetical protein [Verrucomicrobiae bacterium]
MTNESTHQALDKLHLEATDKAFQELKRLEAAATPAPWLEGHSGTGAVVTPGHNPGPYGEECDKFYGGAVVLESCRPSDRVFLIALRNHAATLINQCANLTALMAELDEVHRELGIDYNQSAGAAIRALKTGLGAAVRELERVNNVKDGHPLVSHNLLYNLRNLL